MIDKSKANVFPDPVGAPRAIFESETVSQAWNLLNSEPPISTLVVVKNDGSYAGILHARDLRP